MSATSREPKSPERVHQAGDGANGEGDDARSILASSRNWVALFLEDNDTWAGICASARLPTGTNERVLRAGAAEAIALGLITHHIAPLRRHADNHRAVLRVKRAAERTWASLRNLSREIDCVFPWCRDEMSAQLLINRGVELAGISSATEIVSQIAVIATERAAQLKGLDKGGRNPMVAFATFVRSLSKYYERATGRKSAAHYSASTGKIGGPFVRLVSGMLPLIVKLAEHQESRLESSKLQFAHPTERNLGGAIQEILDCRAGGKPSPAARRVRPRM